MRGMPVAFEDFYTRTRGIRRMCRLELSAQLTSMLTEVPPPLVEEGGEMKRESSESSYITP